MGNAVCGESFSILKKQVDNLHIFGFFPNLCKSWSCTKCRSVKAAQVRNYIQKHFTGDTLYMLTFTMFRSESGETSWKSIAAAWNRLRTAAVRRHGKFSYLRVLEPHKKGGYPHMHVLVDKNISSQYIVKKITAFGFGWNFHCEPITQEVAKNYVSKYLTKGWDNIEAEELRKVTKARIVSVSRGLPPVFYRAPTWEAVKTDVPTDHAKYVHARCIQFLKSKHADTVYSVPKFGGFMIVSDIDIDPHSVFDDTVPYEWDHCPKIDYLYFSGVCQEELFSKDQSQWLTRVPKNLSEKPPHPNWLP